MAVTQNLGWARMEIKKEYHQALYGHVKAPEPLELAAISIQSDNQAKIKLESLNPQRHYGFRP